MKFVRPLSLALALLGAGASNWAAQHDQHKAHHPVGSASTAASNALPGKTTPEMARMAMMEMTVDRLPQTPVKP